MSNSDQITENQTVRLAAAISENDMMAIAEGYLDMEPEKVKNMKQDASNSEEFNRKVIRHFRNQNPENQVQVNSLLLL